MIKKSFWKEWNTNFNQRILLRQTVGNISNSHDICKGFAEYFKSNFVNSGENTDLKNKFFNMFDNYCIGNTEKVGDCLLTYNEACEAVRLLAKNKAPGIDNISAEHLIYAADIQCPSQCVNCLMHA